MNLSKHLALALALTLGVGCGREEAPPSAEATATPAAPAAAPEIPEEAPPEPPDAPAPTPEGGADKPAEIAEVAADAPECLGPTAAHIDATPAYDRPHPEPRALDATPQPFALVDAQPLACGFEKTYGLAPFKGQVTLVTFLSAGCGFCTSQAQKLEELGIELGLDGIEVHRVIVNSRSDHSLVSRFTDTFTGHVFQDSGDAWSAYGARKDDILIYDAEHRLKASFRSGQGPSLVLASPEGYRNVKTALIEAARAR